jgi:hypothetical protein
MGDNNVDGDGCGVDGDGSGGNSPSWQGAGTDTYVPWISSAMVAALRNFIWKNINFFRVFPSETFYRRRRNVRGHPGGPHHRVARPGRHPHHHLVWLPPSPPPSLLWTPSRVGEIGTSGFVLSNSENISCVTGLKHKNSRKQDLALWYLVNRLVPENA